MSFSCQNCRKSRRKCDRGKPTCSRCIKYKVDCVYELPPKHKSKQSIWNVDGSRQQGLKNGGGHMEVMAKKTPLSDDQEGRRHFVQYTQAVPGPGPGPGPGPSPFDINFLQPGGIRVPGNVQMRMSGSGGGQYSPVGSMTASVSPSCSIPRHASVSSASNYSGRLPLGQAQGQAPIPVPMSLPGPTTNPDNLLISTSFADSNVRRRFETSNEFYSHVAKDPFCHFFFASQVLTGPKLIKIDPENSALWFSCIMNARNALQPGMHSTTSLASSSSSSSESHGETNGHGHGHGLGTNPSQNNINSTNNNMDHGNGSTTGGISPNLDNSPDSVLKLINEIVAILPPHQKMRVLLSHFYSNVHGPYPIIDVSQFEHLYHLIVQQRQYHYDLHGTLSFLIELLIILRLGFLSVCSFYANCDTGNPTLEWTLDGAAITDNHLHCIARSMHYMKNTHQIKLRSLILLRLMLLLDYTDKYDVIGWSDQYICTLINELGLKVKDEDPGMWLFVCWNNLHYMLLCGAVHDQFDESIFQNDSHLLDESQTLEEIISLDDKGKHRLEVKHILNKGYQLFKLIIKNRMLERKLDDEQFIQFKLHENNTIDLFELSQPDYKIPVEPEQEIELLPGVRINISMFNEFNRFKWMYFFKIKKLSNQSLLFYHYEKIQSPLFWEHLLSTIASALDVSKNFSNALRDLRFMKTPSRFVVSHVLDLVTNRTLIVIFGIIIRFLYFRLHCRDQELSALSREILLKLFAILKGIVECSNSFDSGPRTIIMAKNIIQLFNMNKLELCITSYENASKEEMDQYYIKGSEDYAWRSHIQLSPPHNLRTYSKMIMTMNTYQAKEVISILNTYDRDDTLFDGI